MHAIAGDLAPLKSDNDCRGEFVNIWNAVLDFNFTSYSYFRTLEEPDNPCMCVCIKHINLTEYQEYNYPAP